MKCKNMPIGLFLGAIVTTLCLAAQEPAKAVKRVPVRSTTLTEGQPLYREYCAVCHGLDGRGAGPAADALKKKPSDLTQIARKNNGKFPEFHIQRIVEGADMASHGSRDMPIWGFIFRKVGPNPELAPARVFALVKYLEHIQAK